MAPGRKSVGFFVGAKVLLDVKGVHFRHGSGANPERSVRIAQTRLQVPELQTAIAAASTGPRRTAAPSA